MRAHSTALFFLEHIVVETRPAVLQCFFKDSRSSILRHEFRDISPGFIETIGNFLSLINLMMFIVQKVR